MLVWKQIMTNIDSMSDRLFFFQALVTSELSSRAEKTLKSLLQIHCNSEAKQITVLYNPRSRLLEVLNVPGSIAGFVHGSLSALLSEEVGYVHRSSQGSSVTQNGSNYDADEV